MSVENSVSGYLAECSIAAKTLVTFVVCPRNFLSRQIRRWKFLSLPEGRTGVSRSDRGRLTSRNEEKKQFINPECLHVICVAEHTVLYYYTKIRLLIINSDTLFLSLTISHIEPVLECAQLDFLAPNYRSNK
jgi:hypothetical protein